MATAHAQRKPTFLWQAILILLPVVVLAAFGLFSLRQDQMLAQLEATERAQAIADELLAKIWAELSEPKYSYEFKHPSFQIDDEGRLIFPPPASALPVPSPFDQSELNAEQSRLWLAAQNAERRGLASAVQSYHDVIDSNPPEHFAAAARYTLGLLRLQRGEYEAAAAMFDSVLEENPGAVGESGLSLRPLAQMKLLELEALTTNQISAKHFVPLDSFYSNAVYQPSPLTPFLLTFNPEKEGGLPTGYSTQRWKNLWEDHELSRAMFSAACTHLRGGDSPASSLLSVEATRDLAETNQAGATKQWSLLATAGRTNAVAPRRFWFTTPGSWSLSSVTAMGTNRSGLGTESWTWLAGQVEGSATAHWYVCRPESELGLRVSELAINTTRVPEYFAVAVELAGKKMTAFTRDHGAWPDLRAWEHQSWFSPHAFGGGVSKLYSVRLATQILATATKMEAGVEQVKVNVYLTSPTTIFERQRNRVFRFGCLIAISILAALIGLAAAWGAFNRQQQLSEMKSNFVSSVSHELRAPIASVRLLAESLERGKVSEPVKQNEYFRFIVQECRRLSSLIENVLDFSRIEQGRKQYEFEPTDITALVGQTVKLMEPCAVEKGVQLKSEIRNPKSEMNVDGRAIQQALVNLIDNAIKHSPKGETVTVGLEVSGAECQVSGRQKSAIGNQGSDPLPLDATRNTQHASRLTPDTSHLTLSVTDHGLGIPASEQERIFERFYRLGSELRRETHGVGIGLSIVKHIVESHGGRVRVESKVGQGSRFTIELPDAKSESRNPRTE